MSLRRSDCVVYDPATLVPAAWAHLKTAGPVRTFNPGLLRDRDGWLFAYRVVGADSQRRIGICRLDDAFRVIAGSQMPLSDRVTFRVTADFAPETRAWFADPRLYRLGGRLFLYWNSGWHEPRNWQFLQELDPKTLQPVGPAREMVLQGVRQKLEKNWTLFDGGRSDTFFAVYSVVPHRVLRFTLAGDGDIAFEDAASIDWSIDGYPASHGGLRGGAPPVWHDGEFWSFCHSVHDGNDGYEYRAAAYRFAAQPPFGPTWKPTQPLPLAEEESRHRERERLNPAVNKVIYPCGAAHDGARWLISHGINDEHCAISRVSDAEVVATLQRVERR